MVIGAVALVVIGPKDLPEVLRTVGRWTSTARRMAREFQGHVDDMIRESEVDKVRDSIREGVSGSLEDMANNIDPDRALRDAADPNKFLPDGAPADAPPASAPAELQVSADLPPPTPIAPENLPAAQPTDAAPPAPDVPAKTASG